MGGVDGLRVYDITAVEMMVTETETIQDENNQRYTKCDIQVTCGIFTYVMMSLKCTTLMRGMFWC